ncbi:MAG: N-acetylmuramoyl-L-alanine amidase [Lentisphaerota bacterium]
MMLLISPTRMLFLQSKTNNFFKLKCRLLRSAFLFFMVLISSCVNEKEPVALIVSGHTTIKGNRGTSTASGKWENEFNDEIVNLFSDKANQIDGIEYVIAPSTQNLTLQDKVDLSKKVKPDLYIEIHHNSGQQQDIDRAKSEGDNSAVWEWLKGFCILYYDDAEGKESKFPKESLKFAELLSEQMIKEGFVPNKYHAAKQGMELLPGDKGIYNRVKPNSLFVLRNAVSPAVLLECGFVINPKEEKILSTPETRQRIVNAINCAISEYFNKKD